MKKPYVHSFFKTLDVLTERAVDPKDPTHDNALACAFDCVLTLGSYAHTKTVDPKV